MDKIINFHNSFITMFQNQIMQYKNLLENKDILDIGSNIGLI
jgi:conjugal transfer/entry exclusion protein